jgi:hypothetical protein
MDFRGAEAFRHVGPEGKEAIILTCLLSNHWWGQGRKKVDAKPEIEGIVKEKIHPDTWSHVLSLCNLEREQQQKGQLRIKKPQDVYDSTYLK